MLVIDGSSESLLATAQGQTVEVAERLETVAAGRPQQTIEITESVPPQVVSVPVPVSQPRNLVVSEDHPSANAETGPILWIKRALGAAIGQTSLIVVEP